MENKDKNNNNSFGKKISAFFGGRGFYIALFMCVAMVGVYAWALLFEGGNADTASSGGYLAAAADAELEGAAVPVGSFDTAAILSDKANAPEGGSTADSTPSSGDEGRPASAGIDEGADGEAITVSVSTDAEPEYYVWPVSGEILRGFDVEALSYDVTMGDWRTHSGIDIAAQMGCKVCAVADGTVESIRQDDMLGTVVTIAHSGGLKSIYANLGGTPTVSVGDSVNAGAVIGSVSDTAMGEIAEASHLHFAMVQDGGDVDPSAYLPNK